MLSQKILISYQEYQRLKAIEKKYIDSKNESRGQSNEAQNQDQSGSGENPSLANIVLSNENAISIPKSQEILNPITVPPPIIDPGSINKPQPINEPSKEIVETKKGQKKRENVKKDELPKEWWYIGIPKYKKN